MNIASKSKAGHTSKLTEIMFCSSCKPHPYQDEKYGPNMRVFNPKANSVYICTVCSKTRTKGE